jgi:hypothetical protein
MEKCITNQAQKHRILALVQLISAFIIFGCCLHIPNLTATIHVDDDSSNHNLQQLYIDLIKKILANTIYQDASYQGPFNPWQREFGQDHPLSAFTMVGMKRLDNIEYCMEHILENKIPGDCIETGVWRGGCTILMKAILKSHGDHTRRVWVADSFSGAPAPNPKKFPIDSGSLLHTPVCSYLTVPLENVQSNFDKFGLLDEQVIFLKGLFSDTLPTAPIEQLALLRLDGDLYESTMDALVNLYPKLSVGGYIIIDDMGSNHPCAQAVSDYRAEKHITEQMLWIDLDGVYWQKQR